MEDHPSTLRQKILESYEASKAYEANKAAEYRKAYEAKRAADVLQQAKLKALQDAIGNYGDFKYVDLEDFLDPDNQNWQDYTYPTPGGLFSRSQGRVGGGTPVGIFINNIRNAKTIGDVYKQSELWDSYDPLSSHDRARKYFRYIFGGKEPDPVQATPSVGSRPVQTTAGGTGGAQGVVAVGGAQGTQGVQGAQTGGTSGTQGSNNGSGGAQAGGTGSTGGMRAGNSGTTDGGTYASAGVAKGGTKTIGYDPKPTPMYNPDNVSLAYSLSNTPISPEMQRQALIDKWNLEHGRTGSTGYATGKGMLTSGSNGSYASPSISNDGTYATGEGIKDANGNVLTNPGGDWEYQYALKNPQYGLGMMGKMSDAQKNYLQAVSNDMGFNYNFTGAPRYV